MAVGWSPVGSWSAWILNGGTSSMLARPADATSPRLPANVDERGERRMMRRVVPERTGRTAEDPAQSTSERPPPTRRRGVPPSRIAQLADRGNQLLVHAFGVPTDLGKGPRRLALDVLAVDPVDTDRELQLVDRRALAALPRGEG